MNKYTLILLGFCFSFVAASQVSNEEELGIEYIVDKKDDILIKSNNTIAQLIEDVDRDINEYIFSFEAKKARLIMGKRDLSQLNFWKQKADSIVKVSALTIDVLLEEMNTIARLADNTDKDYVVRDSYTSKARSLKSINEIENLSNRTVPYQRIFGQDFLDPQPEGIDIENEILAYKNAVFRILGNFSFEGETSVFKPFESEKDFGKSMENVRLADTSVLKRINNYLTLDSEDYHPDPQSDKVIVISWMLNNFVYSSVLETAVSINQVILKIKLIEKHALSLLLSKIESGY